MVAMVAFVPLFAICSAIAGTGPAVAAGNGDAAGSGDAATPQLLAAMRSQADAAQADLTAGAKMLATSQAKLASLQAQAAAATSAVALVDTQLDALRGRLDGYAADLYVNPAVQEKVVALTGGANLATSVEGVEMLTIVDSSRADVVREVTVDEQQAQVDRAKAAQELGSAAVAQSTVTAEVAALQAKASKMSDALTAAQAGYMTQLQKVAAARLAAATAQRDQATRALAVRQATALLAEASDDTPSPADCAAAPSSSYPAGPWGGYSDGLIPLSQLCAIVGGGHLRPDAAQAFDRMSAAYRQAFGSNLCVSDSYRSYSQQVAVFRQRPSLAAVPGTSNHGWGLAVDLGCGVEHYGSAPYRWMTANAGRFGFVHPDWALHDPFEPWHWEFGHLEGSGGT
jgi:D-alanyl-D-alanine dipeptidase